jgi:hypothetical protein
MAIVAEGHRRRSDGRWLLPPDEAMVLEALASLDRLEKQQSRTKRHTARR